MGFGTLKALFLLALAGASTATPLPEVDDPVSTVDGTPGAACAFVPTDSSLATLPQANTPLNQSSCDRDHPQFAFNWKAATGEPGQKINQTLGTRHLGLAALGTCHTAVRGCVNNWSKSSLVTDVWRLPPNSTWTFDFSFNVPVTFSKVWGVTLAGTIGDLSKGNVINTYHTAARVSGVPIGARQMDPKTGQRVGDVLYFQDFFFELAFESDFNISGIITLNELPLGQ